MLGLQAVEVQSKRMRAIARIRTKVLSGHRIEICTPDLPEGTAVEVLVWEVAEPAPRSTLYEWLTAAPPQPKPATVDSWEEYERLLQRERESWD